MVIVARIGEYARVDLERVCSGFELGALRDARTVTGGLSNDMWQVRTDRGEYAVKAMVVNADRPDFVANLEAAFTVELRAYGAGVAMPEPIAVPGSGRCLLATDGRFTRVHAWIGGAPADPSTRCAEAGDLLAGIHAVSPSAAVALDDEPWSAAAWRDVGDQAADPELADAIRGSADLLARLEAVTSTGPAVVPTVESHRDLDPKNALVARSGLLAVDWDAAGSIPVAREAVQVALDWSTDPAGFSDVLAGYRAKSPYDVPRELWVFGGWVSAHAGWLVYNASIQQSSSSDGRRGVGDATAALARLRMLSVALPEYVAVIG